MAKAMQLNGGAVLFEIRGLKQLQRALNKAARDLDDNSVSGRIADVNAEVSQLVAARARQICPKRTGRLAASIKGSRQKAKSVVKAGGARVSHRMVRVKRADGSWSAAIPEDRVRNRKAERQYTGDRIYYAELVHNKNPFLVNAARQTQGVWRGMYAQAVQDIANEIGRSVHYG